MERQAGQKHVFELCNAGVRHYIILNINKYLGRITFVFKVTFETNLLLPNGKCSYFSI